MVLCYVALVKNMGIDLQLIIPHQNHRYLVQLQNMKKKTSHQYNIGKSYSD